MNYLKINIVIEKTDRPELDVLVFGHKLSEYPKRALTNFKIIHSDKGAKANPDKDCDYVVTIKDDMALVNEKMVFDAVRFMEENGAASVRFGKGSIVMRGIYGEDVKSALSFENEETVSVEDNLTVEKVYKGISKRNIKKALQNGAIIIDSSNTYIGDDVVIEKGAKIYPNVTIYGRTTIGSGTNIESGCYIRDSKIGKNSTVIMSRIEDSEVGNSCRVGPFAYFRNKSVIKDECRIGDFVEIKNSTLEKGVKAAHLAYIGDASVGEETNVGCGSIFVNYNGVIKQHTTVGKNVFIGSNSNLIAPITVGDNAYIAAGSTVTDDVPGDVLCIARERQVVKTNWKRQKKEN